MNINVTIVGQSIAFIIFVFFCMKYVWPPLISAIEERQKNIAEGIASAEQAKKILALAQASAVDQLEKAKAEALLIIEQANKHCVQLVNEAKMKAENERTKIIAQAHDEINCEYRRVCEELNNQIASLVIASVEKIIDRSVDATINQDIIDKFITKL